MRSTSGNVILAVVGLGLTAIGPPARAAPVTVDVPTSPFLAAPELLRLLGDLFPARADRGGAAVRFSLAPGGPGVRISGPAGDVARVQRLLARPPCHPPRPGGTVVVVVPLRFQEAATVARRLPHPLPAGARVLADGPTNSLVIEAPAGVAARLGDCARSADRPDLAPPWLRTLPRP